MNEHIKRGTLCSLGSLGADEDMYGTAMTVETWLVLEYNGRWSGEAFRDSKIPDAVKAAINRYIKGFPNSRIQLVKKQKRSSDGIKLFMAHSRDKDPVLYEATIGAYDDLRDRDIGSFFGERAKEPLFLICTNGEHDKCCGKFGMPVYMEAAAGMYGENVWQSTHLGGHRFASTLVCLPHGLYYGRVREGARAEKIFDEYRNGRIELESCRGRSCYSPPVQAAEYFLRKETGVREISAFYLRDAREKDREIRAEFLSDPDEKIFEVRLGRLDKALKILKSCGDKERSFIPLYRLLHIGEA
ncbi:MAG TPA: sucrase ferredoxin [Thermodesulfobacteriota bacterium]|nr:sucrase ferredoxin [Thermodesulfobacteriota bacterium]